MIQSLYAQVVPRQPLGIDSPHFLRIFGPYLSERLIGKIETDRLCESDWFRQTHGRGPYGEIVKPPFAWLELGLFSGAVELAEPTQFRIERSEPREDGSTYVYVEVAEGHPVEMSGDVAVRVVWEGGRPVVDDVIYLKGKDVDFESSLLADLRLGCQGSRWVGRPLY